MKAQGYAITLSGRTFCPGGRVDDMNHRTVEKHNLKHEAAEIAAWAKQPKLFLGYVTRDGNVTTWTGVPIGRVTFQKRYRTNLSHNMVSITVKGNNSASYWGRYGADWTQSVWLHKKVQREVSTQSA